MVRYYSNIVGKYGTPVQNALKKLAGARIDYICSTHGPVWRDYKDKVIAMYDRMSKYETEPGLVICYGTMYGNTERMAEIIAQAASQNGVKTSYSITYQNAPLLYPARYIPLSGTYRGAPTYNAGLYHEMEVLLSEIANYDIKGNHLLGWFGSHSWASKAVGKIQEWNESDCTLSL